MSVRAAAAQRDSETDTSRPQNGSVTEQTARQSVRRTAQAQKVVKAGRMNVKNECVYAISARLHR